MYKFTHIIKMKNYITFLYSLFLFQASYSQTIKGEITNGNQAIPFANISIKGIDKGAAADLDGRFILNNVPEGKQEIVVSAIGYNKYKATFIVKAGLNVYNFVLEESSFELDQVVVTGTMKESFIQMSPVKVEVITQKFLEK